MPSMGFRLRLRHPREHSEAELLSRVFREAEWVGQSKGSRKEMFWKNSLGWEGP